MPLPGTQIQATRGACCLFLVPSGRCKCLLNQLRWVFRLECYKTRHRAGCSPVSHSVSIRRLARHLTKQTQMRPLQKDICAALCGLADAQDTGSTRGGRGWGRSSQRGASGVGGGRSTRPPRCCRLAHHQVRSTPGFLHLKATRKTHAATARNYGRTSLSIRPVVPVHATSKCGGLQGSAPHGHHAAAAFHTIRSV